MAEMNANMEAQGLPPAIVIKRVAVKPLTEAEEKEYDDAQKAAKEERKAAKGR